jgi:hypothetical protein
MRGRAIVVAPQGTATRQPGQMPFERGQPTSVTEQPGRQLYFVYDKSAEAASQVPVIVFYSLQVEFFVTNIFFSRPILGTYRSTGV